MGKKLKKEILEKCLTDLVNDRFVFLPKTLIELPDLGKQEIIFLAFLLKDALHNSEVLKQILTAFEVKSNFFK